ncbi:MAG: sulfite exporter TauE/SafE family protein [Oscillatoria princeps RMCB-10]|jgi:ABC-type nickel/cobalt efflux system permease component RcnA|nr:sulfite exporter TauE/SafE family protein [Oscillatoria princeps RMCB-10]
MKVKNNTGAGWKRLCSPLGINRRRLLFFARRLVPGLGALLLSVTLAAPSLAHWADLAVAEIVVGETQTQVTLTFPTGLVAEADDSRDGRLSAEEVRTHSALLEKFLGERIRLTDGQGDTGSLALSPLPAASRRENVDTHSTLLLTYTWRKPVGDLRIEYDLFLPGVSTASCQAVIVRAGELRSFVFTPNSRTFQLSGDRPSAWQSTVGVLLAIWGSFVWGAAHALSPGHGKTVAGAYLVGARATVKHAVFLALTTTVTHTAGVFALGGVALFASQFVRAEQLYPWLSLLSGVAVVAIGLNLYVSRHRHSHAGAHTHDPDHDPDHDHEHDHDHSHHHHDHSHHHHDHSHEHEHSHKHEHSHHHHHHHHHHGEMESPAHGEHPIAGAHSHLPPGADGSPVTWQSLLALGVSGGILPCPSALVVLLSAWSLGHLGFGLALVLAFSLGLAGVLTGIGFLLIFAKRLFQELPAQRMEAFRVLPAASALFVALLGCGITARALVQIGLVRL